MVEMLRPTTLATEVRELVLGRDSHAPHLLDVEVLQVLRRFLRNGAMKRDQVDLAVEHLRLFPLTRHAHGALLQRAVALAGNVTAYDAMYLALSEGLGAELLTCDAKLVGVPGSRAIVRLVE